MGPPTNPTTIPVNKDDSKQVIMMKSLYNALIEYREPKTQRILIQVFMCLPSRKDFPDYFSYIAKPIAMNKIRERIERKMYIDEEACMSDFKLMFHNCRTFNEDNSQIHRDATHLENFLLKKREQLQQEYDRPTNNSSTTASTNNNNSNNSSSTNANTNTNHTSTSNNHVSTADSQQKTTTKQADNTKIIPSTPNSSAVNNNGTNNSSNGVSPNKNSTTQQSDSTNHSTTDHQNGNEELETNRSLKVNHNHHNETSMDSSSNLSADLLASTPVEKCSLNTRRGRNKDAPKRQLLTGYIIYASEIRKQVIDRNPNQNFGDISRLVGDEWKALPHDIRSKYDQRALIHNKRVRERAQKELNSGDGQRLSTNGLHTPKMTKRKLAKLAKEQMRQHHLSIAGHDDSTTQSPKLNHEHPSNTVPQTPSSTFKHHSQPQTKVTTVESCTQTTAIRFVEPPAKKRLVHSETFKRYIETLQVPNRDLLVEETTPDRPPELPTHWLGAGVGRHETPEAALWALRDFMLQDAVTMRRSMEPYL